MPAMFNFKHLLAATVLAVGTDQAAAESSLGYHNHQTGEKNYLSGTASQFHISSGTHQENAGEQLILNVIVDEIELDRNWSLVFVAPAGQRLAPGQYFRIGCPYDYKLKGRAPSMEIKKEYDDSCYLDPGHTGFDQIRGAWFGIRQLSRNTDGTIAAAEVVFSQVRRPFHGSKPGEHLTGVIRYNMNPLSFELKSEPGFKWGEIAKIYHGDTSLFSLQAPPNGPSTLNEIYYHAEGRRDSIDIEMRPPQGQSFKVGRYQTRSGSSTSPSFAQFMISGAIDEITEEYGGVAECISGEGTLDIKRIATDASGKVTSLVADFAQRCFGEAPLLHGTIRYN